ncbi:hypothetical protein K1719_028685 [Acacia pycnantha]|nr:hypothetical protein K1719_028685 [Acacia pycnantha]
MVKVVVWLPAMVVDGGEWEERLKPINPRPRGKENEEACLTTPTAKEKLSCPSAPRKPRPSRRNNFNGVGEFFMPPDLETVFKRCAEKGEKH